MLETDKDMDLEAVEVRSTIKRGRQELLAKVKMKMCLLRKLRHRHLTLKWIIFVIM
jgi:hypothetical protein